MVFWATITSKLVAKSMRNAEAQLIQHASNFGNRPDDDSYSITTMDTYIPTRDVLPLHYNNDERSSNLVMHSIRIDNKQGKEERESQSRKTTTPPLVLLHGYMNGSGCFYRNFVGLTHYFTTIYSVDMLGWGLSSRPKFPSSSWPLPRKNNSDETAVAEDFFVESLEAWRKANKIDKMVLAGHSMGGYMGVAYCEKYPQHVEQLVLMSPAGVADPKKVKSKPQLFSRGTFSRFILCRQLVNIFGKTKYFIDDETAKSMINNHIADFVQYTCPRFIDRIFNAGVTPGIIVRDLLSQRKGREWSKLYVQHRLPAITDPKERDEISNYLYCNLLLPPSGEDSLNQVLLPCALAKKPTVDRIPRLKVSKVSFMYGDRDWMDISGALEVQKRVYENEANNKDAVANSAPYHHHPEIEVYRINDAGHMLMLDNWQEVTAGIIMSVENNKEEHGSNARSSSNFTSAVPCYWRRPTRVCYGQKEARDFQKQQEGGSWAKQMVLWHLVDCSKKIKQTDTARRIRFSAPRALPRGDSNFYKQ